MHPYRENSTSFSIRARCFSGIALAALVAACESTTSSATGDGGTTTDATTQDGGAHSDAGPVDGGPASCASPGSATKGDPDTHCASPDGGPGKVQPTSPASCNPPDTDAGGDDSCPYGDTLFGLEADDDDCKYHVKWSSTPICEGAGGVWFTLVATNKTDNSPLTAAHTIAETFTTSPPDAGCDNKSDHAGPNTGVELTEGPPGTYTGPIVFDKSGQWTVRFHFHEDCKDTLPDSPHGHAAFHITVP